MKKFFALLALALLLTGALAENTEAVTYAERQGYKIITINNRPQISGCWITEDAAGDVLQWADADNTYTVTGKGLRALYDEIISTYSTDAPDATPEAGESFVLNKKTKKFHRPDCSHAQNMKADNREDYTGTRDDLISQGYAPCKSCDK